MFASTLGAGMKRDRRLPLPLLERTIVRLLVQPVIARVVQFTQTVETFPTDMLTFVDAPPEKALGVPRQVIGIPLPLLDIHVCRRADVREQLSTQITFQCE
jgi:hypothetical protein